MLAEFGSVVDAVECAVSLRRGLAERNAEVPHGQRIQVRIGINLGEMSVKGSGGICVSAKVAREVETKLAFGFESIGAQQVKNIAGPAEAFRINPENMPVRRKAPVSPKRMLPWASGLATAMAVPAVIWFTVLKPAGIPGTSAYRSLAVLSFANIL